MPAKAKPKRYLVWRSDGSEQHYVLNLSEFCRKKKITRRNLLQVAEGKRKSANGWQAKKMFNEA